MIMEIQMKMLIGERFNKRGYYKFTLVSVIKSLNWALRT